MTKPIIIPPIPPAALAEWRAHFDALNIAAADFAKAMIPRFRDVQNGLIDGANSVAEAMRDWRPPLT